MIDACVALPEGSRPRAADRLLSLLSREDGTNGDKGTRES